MSAGEIKITPYQAYRNIETKKATLRLRNSDFEGIPFQEGKVVLAFSECHFDSLVIENEEEVSFKDVSIAFFKCIIDNIQIEKILSKNITVGFYGCIVSGVIRNSHIKNIDFHNCLLNNRFFCDGVASVTIKFSKEEDYTSHFARFLLSRYITGKPATKMIYGSQGYHLINVRLINVSSEFEMPKTQLGLNLDISYSDTEEVDMHVERIDLKSFSLSGNPKGKIAVEHTRIDALYIYDFSPSGQTGFYNIEPGSASEDKIQIGIHRGNLDNVWFDNVNFDRYPIISFYRTKFSKAAFTSCTFPESYQRFSKFMHIENVHYPENRPSNYHKDQYEMFLQFKKSLEDTGNIYEAQKLQTISHEALKQIETISGWDRAILKINSWSNNHGLSIKRPFIGFILFSVSAYILYLFSLNRIFTSANFDPSLIGYYFSFIDLTHRNDFLVAREYFTGWSLFIDYANKLIVSFFIYQFIAAFRKYGRK